MMMDSESNQLPVQEKESNDNQYSRGYGPRQPPGSSATPKDEPPGSYQEYEYPAYQPAAEEPQQEYEYPAQQQVFENPPQQQQQQVFEYPPPQGPGYPPQQRYAYPPLYGQSRPGDIGPFEMTSMGMNARRAGMLCYLFWWVTGLIFLLLERENRFVRFHAMQSILLFGALSVLGSVFGGALGGGVFIIGFVCWIFMMRQARSGRYYKVPIIGDLAERLINQIH